MNRAKEISIVDIKKILPNEKNRKPHSEEQVEELAKIIEFQGFRVPVIVSNRTGLLVSGHGRLLAAKKLNLKKLPVIFQDFDSEEQEYAAGISDNAITMWSDVDLKSIHTDLPDLEPFDISLLGIENFEFEPEPTQEPKKKKPVLCAKCSAIIEP